MHKKIAEISILVMLSGLAWLPRSSPAAERADFAGTWKLNREQSDDPQEKIQDAINSSGRGARRGFGRRGERAGGRGGDIQELMQAAGTLTLQYQDPELTITHGDGQARKFHTDGRVVEQPGPRGGTMKITSRWQDDDLVIERKASKGRVIKDTYKLTGERKQMVITTRLEGPRLDNPITFRRVYDRTDDSGSK